MNGNMIIMVKSVGFIRLKTKSCREENQDHGGVIPCTSCSKHGFEFDTPLEYIWAFCVGKIVFSGLVLLSLAGLFKMWVIDVNDAQGLIVQCRPRLQQEPGTSPKYRRVHYTKLSVLFN